MSVLSSIKRRLFYTIQADIATFMQFSNHDAAKEIVATRRTGTILCQVLLSHCLYRYVAHTASRITSFIDVRGAIATRNGGTVETMKNLEAVGAPAEIRTGHVPNTSDRYT